MKCIICSSSGPFQVSVKGVIEIRGIFEAVKKHNIKTNKGVFYSYQPPLFYDCGEILRNPGLVLLFREPHHTDQDAKEAAGWLREQGFSVDTTSISIVQINPIAA